ncbi:Predicted 5' DNA nuclease, flap endonuclease-1-like, helix-3-turn-helix (H3TH) domain [Roseovarius azorensis]|uniref:Predicted 5' DNA nuclease, flap endonuclease-1-like, helix-3-turn-helix (H3TH) domain n=1 Tax=Roseovarius azorensis TaxID=1287727 RepID=A0A1H7GDJ4_9RHOB|nr:NADH:ubiquinone oxidoreductase [Roseovarius azorensis]SEK36323.1 Predicted 5' DNA nuclease, flap endonuclease-1-like, helix-3-turn-helix (H3TH) domain [Roseovarius azorensis]
MSDTSKLSTCQIVCWGLAALTGILVIWSASGTVGFLAALLLGVAFAIFFGLVITRLVCTGYAPGDRGIEPEDIKATMREVTGITGYKAPDDEVAHVTAAEPAATVATAPAEPPAAREAVAVSAEAAGIRPEGLSAPRDGQADDLKQIKGIGPKLEQLCHGLGFYHFDQIAGWGPQEVAWVDANLKGFKGRVSRDNWVEQARTLAAGGETEFSRRVEGGDVY